MAGSRGYVPRRRYGSPVMSDAPRATTDERIPTWIADAVFYQIFPDRFAFSDRFRKPANLEPWDTPPTVHGYKGGDLYGIVEKLDHLVDLGVNAIYLNPIFTSASNHRYHTMDYLHVDPLLGGDEAFDELLEAAHSRGIRVVLDGVFNHAGRGFLPFNDIAENHEKSPWIDWFKVQSTPLRPYDEIHPPRYEAWWNLHALPKFNTDNPDVREFLISVGEHWIRKGIDGWRLDVPQEVTTPGFWEEFRARVRALNPDAYIVGEVWSTDPAWVAGGGRFDGVMNYPLTAAIASYVIGDSINHEAILPNEHLNVWPPSNAAQFGDRIEALLAAYPPVAHLANLNLLDSHDTSRFLTLASGNVDLLVMALVLTMTFPGAPCLYYGTEIGLGGGLDPDNRRSMPWDESMWDKDLLATTKELIRLRREHDALRSLAYERLGPPNGADWGRTYVFVRGEGDHRILVATNPTDHADEVPLTGWNARERLAGAAIATNGVLELPPYGYGIWAVD
jgi:cyclomaltodextrinase